MKNEVRKGIVLMLQHNFPEAELVEADGVTTGLKLIATEHCSGEIVAFTAA